MTSILDAPHVKALPGLGGRDDRRITFSKAFFGAAVVAAFATGLSAGSAHAADVAITTCGVASPLSFGDKTVTSIVCDGVGDETEIRFNAFGIAYDFGSVIAPPTQGGSISYTISIIDPTFKFASVGLDSGCILPTIAGGGCTVTKNVSWAGGGFGTLVSTNGGPAPGSILFGAADVLSLDVEDVFFAQGPSAVSTANNFYTQATRAPEEVPAPLPILGAGAAFGFSRKLRSRIKKSAATA
jgi:hypothetical protein